MRAKSYKDCRQRYTRYRVVRLHAASAMRLKSPARTRLAVCPSLSQAHSPFLGAEYTLARVWRGEASAEHPSQIVEPQGFLGCRLESLSSAAYSSVDPPSWLSSWLSSTRRKL